MELLQQIQNFIDWLKNINWVLSLVAAIPLSIVANIFTPKVQNWFGRKSENKANKRIKELKSELKDIEQYVDKKENLYLFLAKEGFRILILMGIGNFTSILPYIAGIFGVFFYLLAINICMKDIKLIDNVINFGSYKNKIYVQIEQIENSKNVAI